MSAGAEKAGGRPNGLNGFQTAEELAHERARQGEVGAATALAVAEGERRDLARPLDPTDYVMAPVMNLTQAKDVWNAYLDLKNFLLRDDACADNIGSSREMNRTGATRLATAFGLCLETVRIDEGSIRNVEPEQGEPEYDYRFLVRARASRGARFADGIASCRLSEIPAETKKGERVPLSQREHFALTKADTRARKRAIADLLGGTEAE